MRIAFDGTTLRAQQTGVGLYSEHLFSHLSQRVTDERLYLISNQAIVSSRPLPEDTTIYTKMSFPVRAVWMQCLAPFVLKALEADVAHFTNSIAPLLTRTPTVLSVHDMSLELFPGYHPKRRLLTRPLIKLSVQKSAAVVTVSEHSRNDIIRLLEVPPERVHVIPEAAAPCFRPCHDRELLETVRHRYGLGEKVVLFVGTLEPRKNVPRLIRSFKHVVRRWDSSCQLICAGAFGWGYQAVKRAIEEEQLQGSVKLLGYVPYEDLPRLYSLATIFIFPSFYEGFGLPVIEAMACGTPVITSNNSSLAEIAEGSAELIDPLDCESMAHAMIRLLSDPERRIELSLRGLETAARYSWVKTASETLSVYRKVGHTH
ncbi:MAG TPA: glycosyltransferase family 1 protein [Acidobacteriota bacterium]|nr:glycosyltransferase family 1 protein [Acidobacteriota bacterium]